MSANDEFGAVVRHLLDDLSPGEAFRAKVTARRRRRRRQRQILGITGSALVLVASIGVSSVLDEDPSPVVADGRDSSAACAMAGRDLVPTWLPPGWSTEPVSTAERRWLGPDGAQIEIIGHLLRNGEDEIPGSVTTVVEDGGSAVVSAGDECLVSVSGNGVSGAELTRVARSLVKRTDAFAMWPDTDPVEELHRIQIDDNDAARRSDPSSVAIEFVRESLDWREVVSTVRERSAHHAVVAVTDNALGVEAEVELRSRPGTGPWSVFQVSTFPADHPVEVSIDRDADGGGSLQVRVVPDRPAATSEVAFRFGGIGGASAYQEDQPNVMGVDWDGSDSWDADAPGSVLVRFFDGAGATIAAWGIAVPAGDYRPESTIPPSMTGDVSDVARVEAAREDAARRRSTITLGGSAFQVAGERPDFELSGPVTIGGSASATGTLSGSVYVANAADGQASAEMVLVVGDDPGLPIRFRGSIQNEQTAAGETTWTMRGSYSFPSGGSIGVAVSGDADFTFRFASDGPSSLTLELRAHSRRNG